MSIDHRETAERLLSEISNDIKPSEELRLIARAQLHRWLAETEPVVLGTIDWSPPEAFTEPTPEPEYAIDNGWLVTVTKNGQCNCNGGDAASNGAHESYCGREPLHRLDNLPGWPEHDWDAIRSILRRELDLTLPTEEAIMEIARITGIEK